jgi:hypothetical protein
MTKGVTMKRDLLKRMFHFFKGKNLMYVLGVLAALLVLFLSCQP